MAGKDQKQRPALPDWHLWSEVTRTVQPLHRQPKPLLQFGGGPLPLPPAAPAAKAAVPRPAMPSYRPGTSAPRPPERPALEPRLRRRLGRGQVAIDGTIDLHGMRQAEAHAALRRFLTARAARGDRNVLVITGKGLKKMDGDAGTIVERGVLRAMLPIWLVEPGLAALVAGWDVAAQGHGGEGAFYVRLRRRDAHR